MTLAQPRIRVVKSLSTLDLFDGRKRIKTYHCITGTHSGDKQHEGDRKTPEGLFRVVFKNPHSKFHLSLGLNYPNEQHAGRGLAQGLLTVENYNQLMHDLKNGDMTDKTIQNRVWKTPLGGEIFIHGCAEGRTSTAGCVALNNPEMTELYELCPVGTPVEILA